MNKNPQNPTQIIEINPEMDLMKQGISPIQKQAAIMIASGETISNVATRLNINRSTIYSWLDKVSFQCFMNQQCKEIQDSIRNGLFSMYKEALEAIRENLQSKNELVRMKAAAFIIDKVQSESIGEVYPEKEIRKQCTTDDLSDAWNTYFDEKKYNELIKENGLM